MIIFCSCYFYFAHFEMFLVYFERVLLTTDYHLLSIWLFMLSFFFGKLNNISCHKWSWIHWNGYVAIVLITGRAHRFHAYIYAHCIYIYIHVPKSIYINKNKYVYIYIHVCVDMQLNIRIDAYRYVNLFAYKKIIIYMHIDIATPHNRIC